MIKWECKSSQVNLWWLATTPVKRRHKAVTSSALSLYIGLTFLRLYISYDSEIVHWKGVSKTPAFLLSLLLVYFWVWPFLSLPHLALAGLALLLSLWVLLYSKQHRFHPRPPCLILIPKTFIDLCFVFKQLTSLRNLKETCDGIWTSSISCKLAASHRKTCFRKIA